VIDCYAGWREVTSKGGNQYLGAGKHSNATQDCWVGYDVWTRGSQELGSLTVQTADRHMGALGYIRVRQDLSRDMDADQQMGSRV